MWGIVPAAGQGTRIQPLAFSKELLPVYSHRAGEPDRPRAVSDFIVERMVLGGANKICFVVSPGKSDILEYYGGAVYNCPVVYAVQPKPVGFCDAIFRALPVIGLEDPVLLGMPDTIWFPEDAFQELRGPDLCFLLFDVAEPWRFDAVSTGAGDRIVNIQVKRQNPDTSWIWGACRMSGRVLHHLHELWVERGKTDEYLGTLVNAYIGKGGIVRFARAGTTYLDLGTVPGHREALRFLDAQFPEPATMIGSVAGARP